MIEIKNGKLVIDGNEKCLSEINIIRSAKNRLFFSNNITEISQKPYSINELYEKFQQAELDNFALIQNFIINLKNIEAVHISYYQSAGLSIYTCSKDDAELYILNLDCANGKVETISFDSLKEAEDICFEINNKLVEIKQSASVN